MSITIIDLVTSGQSNLFDELLGLVELPTQQNSRLNAGTYAVSCRIRKTNSKAIFEAWPHELTVGSELPELPIWLREDLAIPLNLETSYEETCKTLRIA